MNRLGMLWLHRLRVRRPLLNLLVVLRLRRKPRRRRLVRLYALLRGYVLL